MSLRWWQRETPDLSEDRAALAVERHTARDLLHQASDLVLEIRAAAERMEAIVKELAEEEEADGTGPGTDVAGSGAPPDGPTGG